MPASNDLRDVANIVQEFFVALGTNSLVGDVHKHLRAFDGDTDYIQPDSRPFETREYAGFGDDFGLNPHNTQKLAQLTAWLFLYRPLGCPIRAQIPTVVAKLTKAIRDSKAVWDFAHGLAHERKFTAAKRSKLHAVLCALAGGAVLQPSGKGAWTPGSAGDVLLIAPSDTADGGELVVGFRPAAAAQGAETLAKALELLQNQGIMGDDIELARWVTSDDFAAFADRVKKSPVKAGSFEANPLLSAPEVVGSVKKKLGLDDAAAALYLQLLTLPEPTDESLKIWNAWDALPAQPFKALLASKLIVPGKYPQAGRSYFVPGKVQGAQFSTQKAKKVLKNRPIEKWKLPLLYQPWRMLPRAPCHLLFERAWAMVEKGNGP